jgi:hypothetical protein
MNLNSLKVIFKGLSIFTLMIASLPAASGLPRVEPSAGPAEFTHMDLVANIETIGVAVSGSGLPKTAQLFMRATGATDWRPAQPLMLIADGRLIGSLFSLSPDTSYDIKVTDGTTEITGSVTTQPDTLSFTPAAVLYVSAKAPAGGDGSAAAPFRTIQEGVNHAAPGTQVLVADGVYHEAVTFPASGTAGQWIQVKAQGSGAILEGSTNRSGKMWTTVDRRKRIYSVKITLPISYLARDGKRFYNYDTYKGLTQGLGHNSVPLIEGWYFDTPTSKLFVRSQDDPARHTWEIPTLNQAFNADGHDWLWIEGFEMRFYGTTTGGCGVCTTNVSHLVIRKNKIHNMQLGIFFNWTGAADQGNDTRVENNEIYDPGYAKWPWSAVKASSMEGTAIVMRGHIGAIVRGNSLHDIFNGVYTGSSGDLQNTGLVFDADVYNNHINHIGDDALEPEGTSINQRFHNNTVDTIYSGMSLAPVTMGPVWVLRNTFTNYTAKAYKWDGNPTGIVLIYHNTSWTSATDIRTMDVISPIHNAVFRNNIFQGKGLGLLEQVKGSSGIDMNNDNWYIVRVGAHFQWENVFYNNLAGLCTATGFECNGLEKNPQFANPAIGIFTLLSSSPDIDKGVLLPGINDNFTGIAPDLGAFEFGSVNP